MAQIVEGSQSLSERVNELYWSGSTTVEEIIDDLGISRSSLYASIEPLPAGLVCADCHERMVYNHRTMRDRGVAVCPECGRESEPGAAESSGDRERPTAGQSSSEREVGLELGLAGIRDTLRAVPPQRVALVGGGAALGVMAGAVAARVLRPAR